MDATNFEILQKFYSIEITLYEIRVLRLPDEVFSIEISLHDLFLHISNLNN